MKLQMYAIHDGAVNAFGTPFFVQNDAVASRCFTDLCANDGTPLYHHPSDFALHHLGVYDDEHGAVICNVPRFIARGSRVRPINGEEIPYEALV